MANNRDAIRRVLALWGDTAAIRERRKRDLDGYIAFREGLYNSYMGIKLDGMPKAVGRTGDPTSKAAMDVANIIESIDRAISNISKEIQEITERKEYIDSLVKELSPEEQKILEYRYVLLLDWKVIQDRMGYAEKYTQELERIVIDKMSEYVQHRGRGRSAISINGDDYIAKHITEHEDKAGGVCG